MTDNSFCIRVRTDVVSFLDKLGIFQENAFSPENHYAKSVREIARASSQWDIMSAIWSTHSYDILLTDNSIFQFHKEHDDLRYCFMQNPKVKVSWEEYLHTNNCVIENLEPEELELWRGCYDNGDDDSCYHIVNNPVYFRYDLSGSQYREGFHPYSHMHIGLHNEIRLPISKILTPEMFTQFAVKMAFPELWKEKIGDSKIAEFNRMSKNACEDVPKEKWSEIDKYDLFLQ